MDKRIINIWSPDWDAYSGFGRKSLELTWYLTQLGYHVNPMGSDPLAHVHKVTPQMAALLKQPIIPALGGIVLGYPTQMEKYGDMLMGGPILCQTMFESTKFPEGWRAWLNKATAVAVPSTWLINTMKDNGVVKPIKVIPEGISQNFRYVERPIYPHDEGKPFTFLAIGDRGLRKGWDVAALAFHQAFGDDPQYKLIIKARDFGFDFGHPNVEIIREDYTEAQLQALYAGVHCFVFPTRGEGFGLPPREAAATGLPVLATEWSGTADDISAWGYPIRYKKVRAWKGHPEFEGLGKWAEPDQAHLAQRMIWVASRKRYLMWHQAPAHAKAAQLDLQVARRVRKLYDWEKFAQGMAAFWDEIVSSKGRLAYGSAH